MTEKQKDTIKAFCEWLQANNISHIILAADDEGCFSTINGKESEIGAAMSATLIRDDDFRGLILKSSIMALVAAETKKHKEENE